MRSKPKLCIDIENAYFDPVENEDGSVSYTPEPWAELFDDLDARARHVIENTKGRKDWRAYVTWWAYAILQFARAHNRPLTPCALELCLLAFEPKDCSYVPDELRTLLMKPSGESKKDIEWRIAVRYVADKLRKNVGGSHTLQFRQRLIESNVMANALAKHVTSEAKKQNRHCNLHYKDARAWLLDTAFAEAVDAEIARQLDNEFGERLRR